MKDRCVGIIPGDNDSVARSKVGDHSAATVCRGFRSHPDKKLHNSKQSGFKKSQINQKFYSNEYISWIWKIYFRE